MTIAPVSSRLRSRSSVNPKSLTALRESWWLVYAGTGSAIVCYGLFRPWVSAEAAVAGERVDCNAFGRVHVSTSQPTLWASGPPSLDVVNGTWGYLAGVACVLTMASVVFTLGGHTTTFSSRLTLGSAAAVPVFVVVTMAHLSGRSTEIMSTVMPSDTGGLGTEVGLLIRSFAGNGAFPIPGSRSVTYGTPRLTMWPMFAAALSVTSAVVVGTRWWRGSHEPEGVSE